VFDADMAFNLELDLDGGEKFQAGYYARFTRKKINTKKWGLR
jgi:hypothetical protein